MANGRSAEAYEITTLKVPCTFSLRDERRSETFFHQIKSGMSDIQYDSSDYAELASLSVDVDCFIRDIEGELGQLLSTAELSVIINEVYNTASALFPNYAPVILDHMNQLAKAYEVELKYEDRLRKDELPQ